MHEMWEMTSNGGGEAPNRRYTSHSQPHGQSYGTDDLHAWSIYRQNLNSDFTDSALGSEERSPLPYGNFQLREQTVQSILRHPRLAPRSELANNMYAYLKFGLPRVFPPGGGPTGMRDNASDVHALDRRSQVGGSGMMMRAARSETDLVNGGGGNHTSASTVHLNGLISNRFRKPGQHQQQQHGNGMKMGMKAVSENNLLVEQHQHHGLGNRPTSRAGSKASLVSRNSRPHHHQSNGHLNRGYVGEDSPDGHPGGDNDTSSGFHEFPHLQIRNLGYDLDGSSGKKSPGKRVLDGISVDLHGGDCLAILATNGVDATRILDILAGRTTRGKIYGEVCLNGNPISVDRLGSRVAYVRKDYRLHGWISVEHTLAFHARLRSRDLGANYLDTKIAVLLEELGLGSVRKSLVSTLTSSERQRLVVACQLITGAEILCLDDATHGMDIFDTFFLVEYLRNWSSSPECGRIVVMSIHPPTYEIFSMFSKVALVSTGRLMFYGHRREMLPYFAFIEYPCPAFKNPSDYYLDLVTLDNLSSEALIESSQRIETLADSYRRKQEMIQDPAGPPQPLPPRIKNAGLFRQFYALTVWWQWYGLPWRLIDGLLLLMLTTAASICIGALYWNIRLESVIDQNNIGDRLGFHWVLLFLMAGPLIVLLSSASDAHDMECVARDLEERLYSKAVFFVAKNVVELPYLLAIYVGYLLPAYLMAGLATNSNADENYANFQTFLGYSILYIHTLRLILQGLTYLLRRPSAAITIFIPLLFLCSLGASFTLHPQDLGSWVAWTEYASPLAWTFTRIAKDELSPLPNLICPSNPVRVDTDSPILTQLECRINSGSAASQYFGLEYNGPVLVNVLAVAGAAIVAFLVGLFSFILKRQAAAVPPVERP